MRRGSLRVWRGMVGFWFVAMGLFASSVQGYDVLITEIMYHPSSQNEPEEYIELYNRGATAVDLSGWRIRAGVDFDFPRRMLGSHEYLVIAANVAAFQAKYPTVTNVIGGWVGRLRDKGEPIEIRDDHDAVVNRVYYSDEGDWSFREQGPLDHGHRGWLWSDLHDGGGRSLELINMALPNEYGQNWTASLTTNGTPGTTNSVIRSNIPPMIVDVTRLPIIPRSGQATTITARIIDELPGGVVAAILRHRVDGTPAFTATPMLDNGLSGDGQAGDGVYGATMAGQPNGTIVEYYIEARDAASSRTMPGPAMVGGIPRQITNMLYLVNDESATSITVPRGSVWRYLDNGSDQGAVWKERLFNDTAWSTGAAELGYGDQDEQTTVSYGSDINYKHITTYFRHAFNLTNISRVTALEFRLLRDDGAVVYLNGRPMFRSNMPGGVIDYRTTASTNVGVPQESQFYTFTTGPAALVEGRNVLAVEVHQVSRTSTDISFNLELACTLSSTSGTLWTSGTQPLYFLVMTEAERAELADIGNGGPSTDQDSDAQMNGTFISVDQNGVQIRYNAGFRNRGHGSRLGPPNNYRVNFAHDRPWTSVTGIDLNCRYIYLQLAASRLFDLAGLANPDAEAVKVRVNGSDLAVAGEGQYGSYVCIEVKDSDFVERHFPSEQDANIYKCMRIVAPGANLRYQGTDPTPYRVNYFKDTNEGEDDWSDLVELTNVLNNTPNSTYVSEVNRVVNVEQWLRFMAINELLVNAETTLANGNGDDYYLLFGETDPRSVLIQHDLDSVFGRGQTIGHYNDSIYQMMAIPVLDRMIRHPAFAGRYYYHLVNLMDTVYSPEQVNPLLDDLLGDFVPPNVIAAMKSFVVQRNAYVRSQIPTTLTIQCGLPKVGGYYRSTVNLAAVYGTANAALTQSLLVNGHVANWAPFTGTWSYGSGTSGSAQTFVNRGSVWRYHNLNQDLLTAWRERTYSDTTWATGTARLGFGGDGETQPPISGGPAGARFPTIYFRHSFTETNPSSYTSLTIRLTRDDGAVVWLNGRHLCRSNMGQGEPAFTSWSLQNVSAPEETQWFEYTTGSAALESGNNALAVEVHQSNANSGDLGIDLELEGTMSSGAVTSGVLLVPGINRIFVQAFDGPNGTGNLVDSGYIDVWYDTGLGTNISGTLTTDTTLTAPGPWHVTGDIIVPVGVTLTIAPGTTMFFDPTTQIIVYGRLLCEGTESQRIHLTYNPSVGTRWEGIRFDNTHEDNRIGFTAMDYGDAGPEAIRVTNSQLLLDGDTWTDTNQTVVELSNSNLLARNCSFPSCDNNETIHGSVLPTNGYVIFDGNAFGHTTGYSDVIDFTGGKRPAAILQILNNVFLGGSDDALDLDGTDAHIEGNLFQHFHQDAPRSSSSNAIATGTNGGNVANIVVCRNIFYHNDHDVLLKEGSSMTAQNNTFIGATIASINFDERNNPVTPGYGCRIEGCIFRDMTAVFQNQFSIPPDPNPIIRIHYSDVPTTFLGLGVGNINLDPKFVSPNTMNYSLLPGSPCIGTGPNGLDMGAMVPPGASISGEPPAFTTQRDATLIIAGPGIIAYRFSLDGGAYGPETRIGIPIHLTGLTDGDHTIYVLGKNSAGVWQAIPTRSKTWAVGSVGPAALKVTEVMYDPLVSGDYEFLELHNTNPDTWVDLTSMTFTNGITLTFPSGSSIPPNGYGLVVRANNAGDFAGFRMHYGLSSAVPIFGPYGGRLANEGERVTLVAADGTTVTSFRYDNRRSWPLPALAAGHSLVPLDTVVQAPGSLDYGGNWRFSTFLNGSPGAPDPISTPTVVLNEIAAHTHFSSPGYPDYDSNDWIELRNCTSAAINLSGWYLSDDAANLVKWAIPTTATIPAHGRLVFDEITGFHHPITTGFGISQAGEQVFLSHLPGTAANRVVDAVTFKGQELGVSLARKPDGGTNWYDWYATVSTRNTENTSPIADVVISEFMYNPPTTQVDEYVELYNPTSHSINLFNATGPWQLSAGVDYVLPPGISIPAGGYVLVVKFNPSDPIALAAFKNSYGLTTITAQLIGPFTGNLSNAGERLALERPQAGETPLDPVNWVIVDEAIYFDQWPWTDQADGTGKSLHRVAFSRSGNDPSNWIAGQPNPGDNVIRTGHILALTAAHGTIHKIPDYVEYAPGTTVTLTVTADAGYHFTYWSGDVPAGHETDNPLILTMDADKALTANFAMAPPGAPTVNPEPPYTWGTSNTVFFVLPPGAAASYVRWATNASFTTPSIVGNSGWLAAPQAYYAASGLVHGQIYYYRVRARNVGLAEGPWSNVVGSRQDALAPTTPGTPTDAGAYTTSTSVRFNWTASTDSGSGVASYDLQVGTAPGANNVFNGNVGRMLTRVVLGANGRRLYARVRARDIAGNIGAWSNASDGILIDTMPPGAPGIPQDTGAYTSSTTVIFNWAAASDGGTSGSGVASYDLQVGTAPGAGNIFNGNIGNVLMRAVVGANGQRLYARVRARDRAGRIGPWASSNGILVDTVSPTAPGTPRDTGIYTSSTTVWFTWTAAADVGTTPSGIASYDFQVGTTAGGNNVFSGNIGNVLTRALFGANGQTLYARVRSRDRAGNAGPWSASSDGIIVDTVQPRLTGVAPLDHATLQVTFGEPVKNADKVFNYSCTRGLTIQGVVRLTDSQYRLSTSDQLWNTSYTLTVKSAVTDRAGNPINPFYRSRAFRGGRGTDVRQWQLYR